MWIKVWAIFCASSWAMDPLVYSFRQRILFRNEEDAITELRKAICPSGLMEYPGTRGWTALHLAAASGHGSLLKVMLALSHAPKDLLLQRDSLGKTALHLAASMQNSKGAKVLLESSQGGWYLACELDQYNRVPLHDAVETGNLTMISLLLESVDYRAQQVMQRDDFKETPIDLAFRLKKWAVLDLFTQLSCQQPGESFFDLSLSEWTQYQALIPSDP